MRIYSLKKRVCIVVQNYYDTDPRVRREAEALVEAGFKVDVLGLRHPNQTEREHNLNSVRVFTLNVPKSRSGKWGYLSEYLKFFILASFWLTSRTLHLRYDIIQVCTLPDFLVFAALIPKLLGAKIVLDMHEVMPEFYMSKYKASERNWMIRVLKWQEKASVRFADHILTINEPICQLLFSRGLKPDKVTIVMNSADENMFLSKRDSSTSGQDNVFRMMYHGTITHIYGLDIAVRALSIAQGSITDAELWIIGDGPEIEHLKSLVLQLSLKDKVKFIGSMPQQEIPTWLTQCTVGLLPTRRDTFWIYHFLINYPNISL